MSEMLFVPQGHKSHIFEPTCNVLFVIWTKSTEVNQKQTVVLWLELNILNISPFVFFEENACIVLSHVDFLSLFWHFWHFHVP